MFNTFQPLERYDDCAVVGSSSDLLDQERGPEIDSRDCVVRMNDAPTEGYEKHVGSRTTYRVVNGAVQMDRELRCSESPSDWMARREGETFVLKPSSHEHSDTVLRASRANAVLRLDDSIRAQFTSYKEGWNSLSTGLFAVWLFKRGFCSENLDVFGFDHYTRETVHYYEDVTRDDVPDSAGHEWERERKEIERLVSEGSPTHARTRN